MLYRVCSEYFPVSVLRSVWRVWTRVVSACFLARGSLCKEERGERGGERGEVREGWRAGQGGMDGWMDGGQVREGGREGV